MQDLQHERPKGKPWPRVWRGASPSECRRTRGCGAPAYLLGVAESGRVVERYETTRRCASRWCEYCSTVRSQAAYAAIERTCAAEQLVMLTLTMPVVELEPLDSPDATARRQARYAVSVLMDHWRSTVARARTRKVAPPRRRNGTIVRYDRRGEPRATTYAGRWSAGRLSYCAVLQVAGWKARRYHPHLHVLCPDLATAELLNAAWQAGRSTSHWYDTNIRTMAGDRAAGYVARYIARPVDIPDQPSEEWLAWAAALPAALYRRRVVNGAGRWRSFGLRRERRERPAVAQWRYQDGAGRVVTPREWHGGIAAPAELAAAPVTDISADVRSEVIGGNASPSDPAPAYGGKHSAAEGRSFMLDTWPRGPGPDWNPLGRTVAPRKKDVTDVDTGSDMTTIGSEVRHAIRRAHGDGRPPPAATRTR